MSHAAAAALGAIAGATIFIGLPVGRIRGISKTVQGILNAVATGVLLFLLWDILSHAAAPIETSLAAMHHGDRGFAALALIFAAGVGIGLLGLVYFNARLFGRTKHAPPPAPKTLAMMIATGFGLHNVTEGFGIAAPLATDSSMPSWSFLLVAGLIGGAPTFLGTVIGYLFTSTYIYVLFLALAAGALLYVVNEMFHIGRRFNSPAAMAWGLLLGFLLAYSTDLFLTYIAA